MRVLLLALMLFAASPAHAAEKIDDGMRAAIAGVIERQIDAFRRDDGAAAFGLASPGIQRTFGSSQAFMKMVIEGYRPVYRPRRVEFLDLVEEDGRLIQRVLVEGPDGNLYMALYPMLRMEDGSWRTDGCYLLRRPGRGA